MYPTIIHN